MERTRNAKGTHQRGLSRNIVDYSDILLEGRVDVGHPLLAESVLYFPTFLREQSLPGLVYTVIRNFLVIHQNDESLDGRKDLIYVCCSWYLGKCR